MRMRTRACRTEGTAAVCCKCSAEPLTPVGLEEAGRCQGEAASRVQPGRVPGACSLGGLRGAEHALPCGAATRYPQGLGSGSEGHHTWHDFLTLIGTTLLWNLGVWQRSKIGFYVLVVWLICRRFGRILDRHNASLSEETTVQVSTDFVKISVFATRGR